MMLIQKFKAKIETLSNARVTDTSTWKNGRIDIMTSTGPLVLLYQTDRFLNFDNMAAWCACNDLVYVRSIEDEGQNGFLITWAWAKL